MLMQQLRAIIWVLILRGEVWILGALVKEGVSNHVPLIGKQGKPTVLFPFLVRRFVKWNLRWLAQIVVDPENVRVGSVASDLLALKHIPRRVGLRKEMFQILMIRSICPREVGG
jgi:hypothetical protein